MAIPPDPDISVTDNLIFEPTVVVDHRTREPAIWVRVISRQTGALIENQILQGYEDYLAFVDQRAI